MTSPPTQTSRVLTREAHLSSSRMFTVDEGRWFKALNALQQGRAYPRFEAVDGPFPADDVIRAGVHIVATNGLRTLLLGAAGHRPRTVLRDGERKRGSMLDADINEGFSLRYSLATRDAWLGLARGLPRLTQEDRGLRYAKKVAREAVIVDDTLAGDWLFYRQIAEGIARGVLFAEHLLPLRRRLWRGSPLAALAELRPQPASQLDKLLRSSHRRLLELYAPRLVSTWSVESSWLLRYRGPTNAYVERASEMAEAVADYLAVLERAGRFDLATPVAEWLVRFETALRSNGSDIRTRLTESVEMRSMRERDVVLAPFERLFAVGPQIVRQRRAFAQTPYGDPRYPEAQVTLQQFDGLHPATDETLLRLYSDVRGAIGA